MDLQITITKCRMMSKNLCLQYKKMTIFDMYLDLQLIQLIISNLKLIKELNFQSDKLYNLDLNPKNFN
jgi:hypothetical protein